MSIVQTAVVESRPYQSEEGNWTHRRVIDSIHDLRNFLDRPFEEGSALQPREHRWGELVNEIEESLSPLYWVFEFIP